MQEIYKGILDILLRKNLSKIEKINLLVNETLISENYIPEEFEETDNKLIYTCVNKNFIKKETSYLKFNSEDNSDDSSNKRNKKNTNDEIEDDNSVLITKSDKNKNKDNTTSLPSAIKTGIHKGWDNASSSKGILKTMRDTYDTIRNNKRLD